MTVSAITIPRRRRGRQTPKNEAVYQGQLRAMVDMILQIQSRLDFSVSSRGWCYILESEAGLSKGDFDQAQGLINDCRKAGLLPLDICATDSTRAFENLEYIDDESPEEYIQRAQAAVLAILNSYTPTSFWDAQPAYLQLVVEKIDLKNLFLPVCREFAIPVANARGWSDLHLRADMMRRFAEHEAAGRRCVLLYCGDHDPAGLLISERLRANMEELVPAVGWKPDRLEIDRFGLNADFIRKHGLSWIENLETGGGRNLADPRHPDHRQAYVQTYIERFGARKCEANSLVTQPDAGRALCRSAILRYLGETAPEEYSRELHRHRTAILAMAGQQKTA